MTHQHLGYLVIQSMIGNPRRTSIEIVHEILKHSIFRVSGFFDCMLFGDMIARPVLAVDSSSHYLSCITLHDNNTTSLFQHYKTNYCAHPNLLHYLVPIIPLLSKSRELFDFIQSFYFPKINPVLSLLGCFLLYNGNQLHSSLL